MNAIMDYSHYNKEMRKGLEDKLFFMDKIKFDNLLDYGCADGALIKEMNEYYPDKKYIGYDFDPKMIKLSQSKNISGAKFFDDLESANNELVAGDTKSIVLCSSLIHEVYSYGNIEQINAFWHNIYHSGNYDYVVIRDMAFDKAFVSKEELSSIDDLNSVHEHGDPNQIKEFEHIWGSLSVKSNLIHFLMKYRYTVNWDREVRENYFPITIDDHFLMIPDNAEIVYFEHYLLPFLKETVSNDFGITLTEKTHVKIIVKLK